MSSKIKRDPYVVVYSTDAHAEGWHEGMNEDDCGCQHGRWELWEVIPNKMRRRLGFDGGEPEDQSLVRNWSWVILALQEAFEAGFECGYQDGFDAGLGVDDAWTTGHSERNCQ